MADDEEDLRINTLHRFEKRSPRLMLQEYSHCEVPAGCGGVVLRWLDPRAGIPIVLRVDCVGRAETWLDGDKEPFGHVMLGAGRHVIAVHLREVGSGWWAKGAAPKLPAPLCIGVVSDSEDGERDLLETATELSWRRAPAPPLDEGWRAIDFEDRGWTALADGAALVEALPEQGRWGLDRALARGQRVFAATEREMWVRVAFTVPPLRRPR